MSLANYFASLGRYHVWATQKLIASNLSGLSDEDWHRDCGLFFHSVHNTVNHLLVTDTIWFARFAEGKSLRMPLDTVLHAQRADVCNALATAVTRWSPWLSTLPPERFDGELAYTRNNGDEVRIPFAPALGHVFNHATHHRGQLTAALTAMVQPGPVLDWVYLLQQEARSS
ncbi:DinB family protein [Variovorax sp. PBL-E5]|uniref:DinB family protein n=1 Tax=Variovorax sp. PBL-E5 TaxID=434014 RepID=UPI001317D680|nr:DinB family protein [Variovorax sp. PBL-E5]VTU37870.1 DinB family protein [Variovorax sp. PBL-E5]